MKRISITFFFLLTLSMFFSQCGESINKIDQNLNGEWTYSEWGEIYKFNIQNKGPSTYSKCVIKVSGSPFCDIEEETSGKATVKGNKLKINVKSWTIDEFPKEGTNGVWTLVLNGKEFTGVPSGYTAPSCDDGIQNGQESGIDCGAEYCQTCPTCTDNVKTGMNLGLIVEVLVANLVPLVMTIF